MMFICLYNVVSNLNFVKLEDYDIQTYLGKLLIAEFDALMSFTNNAHRHAERGNFYGSCSTWTSS